MLNHMSHMSHYESSVCQLHVSACYRPGTAESMCPGTNYWHTRSSKRVCDRRMSWAKRVWQSRCGWLEVAV